MNWAAKKLIAYPFLGSIVLTLHYNRLALSMLNIFSFVMWSITLDWSALSAFAVCFLENLPLTVLMPEYSVSHKIRFSIA